MKIGRRQCFGSILFWCGPVSRIQIHFVKTWIQDQDPAQAYFCQFCNFIFSRISKFSFVWFCFNFFSSIVECGFIIQWTHRMRKWTEKNRKPIKNWEFKTYSENQKLTKNIRKRIEKKTGNRQTNWKFITFSENRKRITNLGKRIEKKTGNRQTSWKFLTFSETVNGPKKCGNQSKKRETNQMYVCI